MRRAGIDLPEHAHDLLEFVHQLGLVLQPAGGVDQQNVAAIRLRGRQGIERQSRRIRAMGARDHRRAGAFTPDLQLLDRSRTKGIAGGQHHLAAFVGELGGELADGGGLAGAVDPDHENDERLLRAIDLERLRHRRQHLLDLGGDDGLDLVGRNRLVVAAVADGGRNPRRHLGAEIGTQQHVLDVLDHGAVELALGDQIGHGAAERTRCPLQAAGKPAPPALFGLFHAIVHNQAVLAGSLPKRKSPLLHSD